MSALTLTLKYRPDQRVDMSPLVCGLLQDKDPAEIGAIELQCGKRKISVNELFTIAGGDTQRIIIKNSFDKLDFIGKDLDGGSISVEGDAGAYLAMGMKSGEIKVSGNAGLYAACEMKKGYLEIAGNAGDFLGGALPGNKMGMKGGTILVKGNVGERAGDHMRRGNILIEGNEGNAGDYRLCAPRHLARMTSTIAGTSLLDSSDGQAFDRTALPVGYAMRRGTLLLWNPPQLQVGQFSNINNDCGTTHTPWRFCRYCLLPRYSRRLILL